MYPPNYDRGHRLKYDFGRGDFARALRSRFESNDCFAIARRLAAGLHEEFKIEGPPFSPAAFADRLGVSWQMRDDIEAEGVLTNAVALHSYTLYGNDELIDGALVRHPGFRPQILLRKANGPELSAHRRLNYTFAHEIGHYILRREVRINSFRIADPEEETLCNVFAEELLMPSDLVREDLERRVCPADLMDLQERYAVSLQALLTRVASFCGDLVGVIWEKDHGQPLRASWATSKSFTKMILCDTGATPVERAFGPADVHEGTCEILLNGKRSYWHVKAMQLSHGSNKVLSIFTHQREVPDRFIPSHPAELYEEFL